MSGVLGPLIRQAGRDLRTRSGDAAGRRVARAGSVDELREASRRALPKVIYEFVEGGANDERTVRRNVEDLDALALLPRTLVDVSGVDHGTTVLGRRVGLPVLGAPTGLCGLVHHDGEIALARALHGADSVYVLAAMSSYAIEEVAAATPGPLWFQTYLWRDRGVVRALLDRAAAAGAEALVVTVDVPRSAERHRDRRNGFGLPPRLTPRTVLEGVRHPRWTADLLRRPRITAANVAEGPAGGDAVSVAGYVDAQFDPSATWEDLAELRAAWTGPLVVKGILHPLDARRAVQLGADAVVVSNHGGRQLDHAASSISRLPAVVDEVGDALEVYLDGGVRRGSDVVKALALGARACLVGRPIVHGLGAGGEAGAARAMTLFAAEVRTALMLLGAPDVEALGPGHVVAAP
ncbi:alpha-hydroxy acid oxidase [Patulibacter sp.]|uniref:alpha-hydroxy acid oxidase n=1 Tax=Patulibacter sp. TaxID=1912859 RepID=UPI002726F30C|nr:alpha-hydroxy acid oxidase [Patulibacter sp.]MDO9407700.1 alpha-hydroxy acid oxidase [Patulibacter sp.]